MGMEMTDGQSNIFVRVMRFPKAGDTVGSHAHNFAHLHYVPRGRLRVLKFATVYGDGSPEARLRGKDLERRITAWRLKPGWMFWAPWMATRLWRQWQQLTVAQGPLITSVSVGADDLENFILIPAFQFHGMVAEVDETHGHCVFAHRTPQGEVWQTYTGWGPAYV